MLSMLRIGVAQLCLTVLMSLTGSSPVDAQSDPSAATFQSGASELVVVPVTVRDRQGRFAPDLIRDRFEVFDNGQRQDIAHFSSEDTPISASIVIDTSGSMKGRIGDVIAATLAFARSRNPDDELFIVEFNDVVRDVLRGRSLSDVGDETLERALRTMVPQGRTALYDGILRGLDRLERARHARSVLILISDGGDNASEATLEQVLDRARRSHVTLYTIGLFDPYDDRDRNPGVLKRLAETTGGERYLPQSSGLMLQVCQEIAREIRSTYLLAFVPPDGDGKYHRLRVRLTGPGARAFQVKTRPGYFAAGTP
jgi:Ca-activated chloride channel family protein